MEWTQTSDSEINRNFKSEMNWNFKVCSEFKFQTLEQASVFDSQIEHTPLSSPLSCNHHVLEDNWLYGVFLTSRLEN